MERHIAWLTALVVVVAVWLGLLCCGAKARKTARGQRESLRRESTEHANGEVQNGGSDLAGTADMERTGNGRCVVEEAREQNGVLMEEIDDLHNASQAKNAKVSTQEFEPCIGSKIINAEAMQHTRCAEAVQEGTTSVVINVEKS